MKRRAAFKGMFYEDNPQLLNNQLNQFFEKIQNPKKVIGVISPHAGYIYSGKVAGVTFSHTQPASTYIVTGPNHRGLGQKAGIMSQGAWEIPFGSIKINSELAQKILSKTKEIKEDSLSHQYEHSIEVQLPFIYKHAPKSTFVPISFSMLSYDKCENIAETFADVINEQKQPITIVASSDMSHYVPEEIAKKRDQPAIDAIKALEPFTLYDYVLHNPGMCGVIPTVILLLTAIKLGKQNAELIKYTTSGETSRDYNSVVAYAGLIVY